MKLNYEDKLKIVKMRDEGKSIPIISKTFSIEDATVNKYLRLHRQYGDDAFKRRKFNNRFSPDLKLKIINRVSEGESKNSLALEYNIDPGLIYQWVRKYDELGYNGLIIKKRGSPKMKPDKDEVINESKQIDSALSSPLTDEERKEFIQLKADYKKLKKEKELSEMENEFLKKLDALVRERLKREGKK